MVGHRVASVDSYYIGLENCRRQRLYAPAFSGFFRTKNSRMHERKFVLIHTRRSTALLRSLATKKQMTMQMVFALVKKGRTKHQKFSVQDA